MSQDGGFMRKIAASLNEWTPEGTAPVTVERSTFAGDLSVPPEVPFFIECKNRKTWKFEDFFKPNLSLTSKVPIMRWYSQVLGDWQRKPSGVACIPIVVFTKAYSPTLAMLPFAVPLTVCDLGAVLSFPVRVGNYICLFSVVEWATVLRNTPAYWRDACRSRAYPQAAFLAHTGG